MSSESCWAIRAEDVSKCYAIFENPSDRLKQLLAAGVHRAFGTPVRRSHSEFWALRGVSLNVRRGECVALLGRNGSGKSTLLQVITGTLTPTTGEVEVNGRVAALLELGSGFNPEFTGLENVYLNASLLGMNRREVDEKLDDILSFADIGEFVAQPVKTYSSGMVLRLAFAVQAQVDPDVLIVDEALAVGDARFQAKCFSRLKALRERGTSILLVTHSTEQVVTHCDRAVLLESGRKIVDGAPRAVVNQYLDLLYGREANDAGVKSDDLTGVVSVPVPELDDMDPEFSSRPEALFHNRPIYNHYEHRWGDGRAEIMDFAVISSGVVYPRSLQAGSMVVIFLRYRISADVIRPILGITLKTKEGLTVYGTNTEMAPMDPPFASEACDGVIRCELELNCAPGDYFVSFGIASRNALGEVVPHDRRYDAVHIEVQAGDQFLGITNLRAELRSSW